MKATSRAKKADIIAKILEQTGSPSAPADSPRPGPGAPRPATATATAGPRSRWRWPTPRSSSSSPPEATPPAVIPATPASPAPVDGGGRRGRAGAGRRPGGRDPGRADGRVGARHRRRDRDRRRRRRRAGHATDRGAPPRRPATARSYPPSAEGSEGTGQSNRRRRRRNRDRNRGDGPQGADRRREPGPAHQQGQGQPGQESFQGEPVAVAGFLDLRDEGYGFLRVNGYLASRDDVYVSVKQTRQYGLRKGDHVTGMARPAGRNEKNPALLRIDTVNDMDPEKARDRPKFESSLRTAASVAGTRARSPARPLLPSTWRCGAVRGTRRRCPWRRFALDRGSPLPVPRHRRTGRARPRSGLVRGRGACGSDRRSLLGRSGSPFSRRPCSSRTTCGTTTGRRS